MIIRTSESWAVKDYSFKFKILDLKYFKVKVNSYGFEYNDDATFKLWLDVDIFDVDERAMLYLYEFKSISGSRIPNSGSYKTYMIDILNYTKLLI